MPPPRITVTPDRDGFSSSVFISQNPFDSGELADHTANRPQAIGISATLVALDVDQCAIEISAFCSHISSVRPRAS